MYEANGESACFGPCGSFQNVRSKVAINHFKRTLLGERHVACEPQTRTVFSSLRELALAVAPHDIALMLDADVAVWAGFRVSEETWESWFDANAAVPKRSKVAALDLYAKQVIRLRHPWSDAVVALPDGFYVEAVYGGLLGTMLARTQAKEPNADILLARARAYKPLSALHLFLDALELRGFADDWGAVGWEEIVYIAAHRIFGELHDRWRPGDGTVYAEFTSDLQIERATASDNRRSEIEKFRLRLGADFFNGFECGGAYPKFAHASSKADIQPAHMHRFLFALGMDENFWVGDRILPWALDLAAAGLVAYALAWTDRYLLLGPCITEEGLFLRAIDALLFSSGRVGMGLGPECADAYFEEIEGDLQVAMELCSPQWPSTAHKAFKRCRQSYLIELGQLGLSIEQVENICDSITERRPFIYRRARTDPG